MLDSRPLMATTRIIPMDTPNHVAVPDEDEIDLLDLLIVIAENLKLLILTPLLIGVIALGVAFFLPKTFESHSMLNPNKAGISINGQVLATYLKSADIIEAAAEELGLEPELSPSKRLKKIEKKIQVSVGKQDQLVTLVTQGKSPEAAQALNRTLWKHVLPLTVPRPVEMARLQSQLVAEEERLKSGEQLEQQTAKLLGSGGANSEATARLYGELLASNTTRLAAINALESRMEGLTAEESLVQQPSLPEDAVKPKKSLIAIAAGLASGFLLLVFVFARHALRSASHNAEQAGKVQRLRRALGLKS